MLIIKLNATNSTNSYLRELSNNKQLEDYTVVTAKHQLQGRGQRGTNWESETGKNLTFSVLKDISGIPITDNFFVSVVTALAVRATLNDFLIPNLSIKWPNDILSANKKIAGILIENNIKKNALGSSIIGIGINVHQTYFENLPQASSLQLITGKTFNPDHLLLGTITHLKFYFEQLKQHKQKLLKAEYESFLFRKNKPSTFKKIDGSVITGYIQGITDSGRLCVLEQDAAIETYDLKQIRLLY
ncbi:biotin--[acetyl-CoA-carboxylase] ligase [Bizionia sediminis]|uniref:Biotin--[acetyl-CoA-carboxylase] ligase n=1 Tax=Bizionia sediminis TaxID=1737064 RepID=A0ABW5KV91_9FLAO